MWKISSILSFSSFVVIAIFLVFVRHLLLARLVRVLRLRLALDANAGEKIVLAKRLLSAKEVQSGSVIAKPVRVTITDNATTGYIDSFVLLKIIALFLILKIIG